MRLSRDCRALTSWIAALAILMAAFAPSISHALGARSGASWIEVCTAVGPAWVQSDALPTDQAPASEDAHPLDHCPYCSLHANAEPITGASAAPILLPALPRLLPRAFLAAPRTLHARVAAQPRAPPHPS